MSVYLVLFCFRMTHLSADVDFVQVGWVVGLTALAACHRGRHAARGSMEEKSQQPGDCWGSFPLSAGEKLNGWGCSCKSDRDRTLPLWSFYGGVLYFSIKADTGDNV